MIFAKHFYMIRHGETEANAARILAGHTDTPLTANGRAQAAAVRPIVEQLLIKPRTIVHSHLSRARDTAAIINETLQVDMHEDPDFAEIDCGELEGSSWDACHALMQGWADPPGGESFENFFERVKRGKNRVLKEKPGPVLIVCHGGLFRAFGKIYGLDNYGVANCHLYEFEPNPHRHDFPWHAWQYDNEDAIIRRPASVFHHEAEEIAS